MFFLFHRFSESIERWIPTLCNPLALKKLKFFILIWSLNKASVCHVNPLRRSSALNFCFYLNFSPLEAPTCQRRRIINQTEWKLNRTQSNSDTRHIELGLKILIVFSFPLTTIHMFSHQDFLRTFNTSGNYDRMAA